MFDCLTDEPMFEILRSVARTRVRFGRVTLLAAAMVGALATAGRGGEGELPRVAAPAQRYVVQPGDTLWRIVRQRVDPSGDPRPMIEDILEANELITAALEPGAQLVLP